MKRLFLSMCLMLLSLSAAQFAIAVMNNNNNNNDDEFYAAVDYEGNSNSDYEGGVWAEETATGTGEKQILSGETYYKGRILPGQTQKQILPGEEQKEILSGETYHRDILPGRTQKQILPGQTRKEILPGQARKKILSGQTRKQILPGQTRKQILPGQARKQILSGETYHPGTAPVRPVAPTVAPTRVGVVTGGTGLTAGTSSAERVIGDE